MSERERALEQALRAFLDLSFEPDGAPAPTCYLVRPVAEAREALRNAGMLLDGKSPHPSDTDGSVFTSRAADGHETRSVWIGGKAYPEDRRDLVPADKLALFDAALRRPE